MNLNNNNICPFAWYTDPKYRNHNRPYYRGSGWALIAPLYSLPPFQILRTTALGDAITNITLTSVATGATFDLTGSLPASGFNVQQFTPANQDPYDLLVYSGATIEELPTPEGLYEATMTDGTNTWYSERFQMRAYVDDLVKIEYWHITPFEVVGHHISYEAPYKNIVYFDSYINKPEYIEEEEVEKRDGYELPIYLLSKKTYRIIGLLLPEYLCDALRFLWMHSYVTISYNGIDYVTDRVRVIFGDWQLRGNICEAVIEFDTDTVATETGIILDELDGGDYDQTDYNDDYLKL